MAAHSDERLKISVAQKKAIRQYYKMQMPRVGHKHIKQWFYEEYGIQLPFSTISNILSAKFDHLDQLGSSHDEAKRCRPPRYPDLEIALTEWINRMKEAGQVLTGPVLLKSAHDLWPNIPAYVGQPVPALSGGWVEKFKTRHNIKLRSMQAKISSRTKSDSDGLEPSSQQTFDDIRLQARNYSRDDIFTMTETELFWRMPPSATALHELSSLPRRDAKERVTVALATNASGTQKLPPWIIGQYQNPRAFHAPGNDIKSLHVVYSSNVIAWMTAAEWRNWIKWFDELMDRRVLLILNPHRAHEIAYSMLADTYTLRNTEVMFLPADVPKLHQPMELGLTQNFKALYRRSLLSFINDFYLQRDLEQHIPPPISVETQGSYSGTVHYMDQIVDPHIAINLYIAAYWIQKAWDGITRPQVNSSWAKSALLSDISEPEPIYLQSTSSAAISANPSLAVPKTLLEEIGQLTLSIRGNPNAVFMGSSSSTLAPDYYVSLPEETPTEFISEFIELCTSQFYVPSEEPPDIPVYVLAPGSSKESAQRAIKLLMSFEEQQPDRNDKYLTFLREYKDFLSHRDQGIRQTSIANILDSTSPLSSGMIMTMPAVESPTLSQSMKRRTSSQDLRIGSAKKLTSASQSSRRDSNSSAASGSVVGMPNMESPTSLHRDSVSMGNNSSLPLHGSTLMSPGQQGGSRFYGGMLMHQNNWRAGSASSPSSSTLLNPSGGVGSSNGLQPSTGMNNNMFFNSMSSYVSPPSTGSSVAQSSEGSQQYNNMQNMNNFLAPPLGNSSLLSNYGTYRSGSGSLPIPPSGPSGGNINTGGLGTTQTYSPTNASPIAQPQSGQGGTGGSGIGNNATPGAPGYPFFGSPVYYQAHAS